MREYSFLRSSNSTLRLCRSFNFSFLAAIYSCRPICSNCFSFFSTVFLSNFSLWPFNSSKIFCLSCTFFSFKELSSLISSSFLRKSFFCNKERSKIRCLSNSSFFILSASDFSLEMRFSFFSIRTANESSF